VHAYVSHVSVLNSCFRSYKRNCRRFNELPSVCMYHNDMFKQFQAPICDVSVPICAMEAELQLIFNVATSNIGT
jgi:hypothetical protein